MNSYERQKRIEGKAISSLFPYYGATGQVGWIDNYLTDGEYILIGEDGAPFLDPLRDKAYEIKGKTWVNNHAHIVKVNKYFSQKFLLHYLNQLDYSRYVHGTTRLKLTKQSLSSFPVPLPPLQEQQRIVSKIDSLFSELEQAEKGLKIARQQLLVYRQTLLKYAFERKFNDSGQNVCDNEKPINELSKISGYRTIADLSVFVGSGSTPKGGRNIYIKDGIPFIRSQNVLVNQLQVEDLVFITPEIHSKMKRTKTKSKDVLLNITGASIGRCAFIPEGFDEANVNQHVCIIRIDHNQTSYKYLTYYLNSPAIQLTINQINTGATREALTLTQVKNLQIPVRDINEQDIIVANLESKFTLIENLQLSIDKSFNEIKSLKYSILKKAFDGKLVKHESSEESVDKLLIKIKREKIDFLRLQRESLARKPKRIQIMENDKTVWQILSDNRIAMRSDKLWSESKHKDDIDAFYAEVKELIDAGKIVEDKRQRKVSYLKIK